MPTHNEIGARAATPDPPAQVVLVRRPAGGARQARGPRPARKPMAPARKTARRSSPKKRRGRQEKRKMIKTVLAIVCALAVYVVLGGAVPLSGHTAVVFPVLRTVPALGAWVCFLTYKGIASLAVYGAVASR